LHIVIESIFLTIFPTVFLIILFGFNKNKDGRAPIDKTVFLLSKYSIVLLWVGMLLQAWGVNLTVISLPSVIRYISILLWVSGFTLLFLGWTGLGESFRIGEPKEKTSLKRTGLYSFSRNPMYVGVYATIFASILYTANPVALAIGAFIILVHHRIILAEEKYLSKTFGKEYYAYCASVRRYL
jgi:protein-S-isoprenylcysteine O-methyltransferase Ste14